MSETVHLTKRTIDALPARPQRYIVWDSALAGFGVRVMPSGDKTFCAKVRIGRGRAAKQQWVTIGKFGPLTPDEARILARKAIAKALTGEEPAPRRQVQRREAITVSQFCDSWLQTAALRSRSRGRLKGALRDPANVALDRSRIEAHIKPVLGRMRLIDVGARDVARLRDAITAGETARPALRTKPHGRSIIQGGDGAATRVLRQFSAILSFAVQEGLIDHNPGRGVTTTPDRQMERFLSPAEMQRLGMALDEAESEGLSLYGLTIIRLLALSGARKGEIERLRWSDIDPNTGFIAIGKSKTGPRRLPLTPQTMDLIAKVPRIRGVEWIFPAAAPSKSHYVGTPRIWTIVRAKAGLDDVRLHDLRHSAASFGLASGVSLDVIGKLLGHADVKTTQRYAHLADAAARKAAEDSASMIADMLRTKRG